MDPRAQDVLLCDLCGTEPLLYCCEHCNVGLCTNCVPKHLSNPSKRHNVLQYNLHQNFNFKSSKCLKHIDKDCIFFCEKCDIPACSTCITSGTHKGHDISDVLEKLISKKQLLQKDLEELEIKVYPKYEKLASDVQMEKARVGGNYAKLITAVEQQGGILHQEITAIISRRKSEIDDTKNKHLAVLQKHTDEITQRMSEIEQVILEMKNILGTNDISLTSAYKARNEEFNKLPPKIKLTLPSLSTPTMNTDRLNEMIGSLSISSIRTVRSMLAEPQCNAAIDTGYKYALYSVRCLNDEQVWICGRNKVMKLLNLQNKLLTSIKTKSGNVPCDIAVNQDGDLVYTDPIDKTVNLVKNNKIRTIITQKGWVPLNVCSTASGDLLVTMISDDEKQSKVVRYSGSTETQTIQFDDQGRPLYSSDYSTKCISENINLDICLADYRARAVVVVNQSGIFRFRYTGHVSNESFYPAGITTDSHSYILSADCRNDRIHILDQDGQFFRYIHNLRYPHGLCVDIRDNLFVAEYYTATVKKIQYL